LRGADLACAVRAQQGGDAAHLRQIMSPVGSATGSTDSSARRCANSLRGARPGDFAAARLAPLAFRMCLIGKRLLGALEFFAILFPEAVHAETLDQKFDA
jgi:hypothetical protein